MNALDEVMVIVGQRFEYPYCPTCALSIPNEKVFIRTVSLEMQAIYHRTGDGVPHFLIREMETP